MVFRLRKPISYVRVSERTGIESIIDGIKPYFDAMLIDRIVGININTDTDRKQGQSQYVQVLLSNEYLRFKNREIENELSKYFTSIGVRLNTSSDREIMYSLKTSFKSRNDYVIYYRIMLNNFYKYMLGIMLLSILGIIALPILMALGLINLSLALPVITTLALILISGYITIPKESSINYDEVNTLTVIAIIVLITSTIITKI